MSLMSEQTLISAVLSLCLAGIPWKPLGLHVLSREPLVVPCVCTGIMWLSCIVLSLPSHELLLTVYMLTMCWERTLGLIWKPQFQLIFLPGTFKKIIMGKSWSFPETQLPQCGRKMISSYRCEQVHLTDLILKGVCKEQSRSTGKERQEHSSYQC